MQRTIYSFLTHYSEMKILLVANGFPPTAFGGVEVYVYNLAKALREHDHDILVFCRESNQDVPDYTIQRHEVDGNKVIRVVNDFKQISTFADTYQDSEIDSIFKNILLEFKPDLVHFNHLIALSATLPTVANELNAPFVMTLHDYWPICHRVHLQDWRKLHCAGLLQGGDCYRCVVRTEKRRAFYRNVLRWGKSIVSFPVRRRIRRRLVRDAGNIIAHEGQPEDFIIRNGLFRENLALSRIIYTPSDFVRRTYNSNGYKNIKLQILPLGVERPKEHKKPRKKDHRLAIGYIGTILPSKGAHILLDAFVDLQLENVRLKLYGRDDADLGYTKKIRRVVNRDQRVSFEGSFEPKMRDQIYQDFDILIIPSMAPESFSLVAREALIRGVPVVASNIGALPEIIRHNENGFLFPPGDVQSLRKLLGEIIGTPDILASIDTMSGGPILSIDRHLELLSDAYEEVRQA
jgi:glycosyltransferase involved in cell wall biosynthesis